MGGLSTKRLKARVVKKSRSTKQKKGFNPLLLPEGIRKHWDKNISFKENFKALGLTLNSQPRMLQSKEGSKITDQATKAIHPRHTFNEESESEEEVKEVTAVDPQVLFPEIKSEAVAPFKKTGLKLAFEEDTLCAKMVKKYGDDTLKMFKDIKMNYLQWSVGQIKMKLKVFHKSQLE
jgi:hypothetical protein